MGTAVSTKKVKKGRASAQLAEGKEKKLVNLLEKTVEQNTIFEGRVIHVRVDQAELPNGKIASREVVEHPGGVTVAALTEKDELLFVRQFRYPFGKLLLELPAGKLERGEDHRLAALRELEEEVGVTPGRLIRAHRKNVSHPGLLQRDHLSIRGLGAYLPGAEAG